MEVEPTYGGRTHFKLMFALLYYVLWRSNPLYMEVEPTFGGQTYLLSGSNLTVQPPFLGRFTTWAAN